jgi:C1A family cysteine protease
MDSKLIAILIALLGAASIFATQFEAKPELTAFDSWMTKHSVTYDSMFERAYRERVFLENLAEIELHNSQSHHTYKMGVNQFTAMTQEEFAAMNLGLTVPESLVFENDQEDNFRVDVNWNTVGAVTPVKNQGQCGSCWAFSTTGGLEGLSWTGYGKLESFSEQQLVDCSSSYGNQGCNGGLMTNSFKFVHDHGVVHESEYAYKGVQGKCSQAGGDFKISGFTEVTNCNDLANALVDGVVSVAVDATNWSRYSSGVFNNCSTRLNHGVTLFGMTDQAWWIKNSWGPTWGEKGFIRLARGNTCGVCNMASYPKK